MPCFDRFDLVSKQDQTSLIAIKKLIVETGPFVECKCFHRGIIAYLKGNGRGSLLDFSYHFV